MNQTLIMPGGAIKSQGQFEIKGRPVGRLGGTLCLFSTADDPDQTAARDFFDATTDFKMTEGMESPVYYHHGQDCNIAVKQIGVSRLYRRARGIDIESDIWLDDRDGAKAYRDGCDGELSWSSGTAAHLVQRQQVAAKSGRLSHRITHWPLGLDASLTPIPAEPRNVAMAIKSLLPFGDVSEMKADGPFEYASTQCNLGEDAADILRNWATDLIPDDVLAKSGRETQPHITVLYGLQNDDEPAIQKLAEKFGPIRVELGEVDCFETADYDVVIVRVNSPDLHRLNGRLSTLDHVSTHRNYQPHLTLAYVESGKGAQFKGETPKVLDAMAFDGFAFSDTSGEQSKITTCTSQSELFSAVKYDENEARDSDGKWSEGATVMRKNGLGMGTVVSHDGDKVTVKWHDSTVRVNGSTEKHTQVLAHNIEPHDGAVQQTRLKAAREKGVRSFHVEGADEAHAIAASERAAGRFTTVNASGDGGQHTVRSLHPKDQKTSAVSRVKDDATAQVLAEDARNAGREVSVTRSPFHDDIIVSSHAVKSADEEMIEVQMGAVRAQYLRQQYAALLMQ